MKISSIDSLTLQAMKSSFISEQIPRWTTTHNFLWQSTFYKNTLTRPFSCSPLSCEDFLFLSSCSNHPYCRNTSRLDNDKAHLKRTLFITWADCQVLGKSLLIWVQGWHLNPSQVETWTWKLRELRIDFRVETADCKAILLCKSHSGIMIWCHQNFSLRKKK